MKNLSRHIVSVLESAKAKGNAASNSPSSTEDVRELADQEEKHSAAAQIGQGHPVDIGGRADLSVDVVEHRSNQTITCKPRKARV